MYFLYSRNFTYGDCRITAYFTVAITFDTDNGRVLGASAYLNSGSIECNALTVEAVQSDISISHNGTEITSFQFVQASNGVWENAMNSIEQLNLAEINADINGAL